MYSARPALAGASIAALLFICGITAANAGRPAGRERQTVLVLTKDGQRVEGAADVDPFHVQSEAKTREVGSGEVLSIEMASTATAGEQARMSADLAAVGANTDRAAREAGVAELTDIGLPVLSPLLAIYKDTDRHEPQPLMRLLGKIMPGYADRLDRTLDMVRLAGGETLRGRVTGSDLAISSGGRTVSVPFSNIRRLAVRRRTVDKTFDVDALRHCTPLEFLDAGLGVSPSSRIEAAADGLVRLSFDIDGWASDADGIKVPGPHYTTNLVDGFPFGALVGRIGPDGPRWLAGRHLRRRGFTEGRLYLAVNDNGHWQNNVGSFRVRLHAADAYDLGDPQ